MSADGTPFAGQRIFMSMTLSEAVYDSQLGRFIASAQGSAAGQTAFYEAPNPWGPWSVSSYNNLSMSSVFESGWGALGGGLQRRTIYQRCFTRSPHRQRIHGLDRLLELSIKADAPLFASAHEHPPAPI